MMETSIITIINNNIIYGEEINRIFNRLEKNRSFAYYILRGKNALEK